MCIGFSGISTGKESACSAGDLGSIPCRNEETSSLQPHVLYSLWNSSGQNIGVGSHSHFQRIFPTQRSNPGILNCRRIFYRATKEATIYCCYLYMSTDISQFDLSSTIEQQVLSKALLYTISQL